MLRVASVGHTHATADAPQCDFAIGLAHDERHLRRRTLTLQGNVKVLIDFPQPIVLHPGDILELTDGRTVKVDATEEDLFQILARNPVHLIELAWHIGNRHLAAEIRSDRLFILRDHVLRSMLEGLGATVEDVTGPFSPTRGAYADPGHHHSHDAANAASPHTHG